MGRAASETISNKQKGSEVIFTFTKICMVKEAGPAAQSKSFRKDLSSEMLFKVYGSPPHLYRKGCICPFLRTAVKPQNATRKI